MPLERAFSEAWMKHYITGDLMRASLRFGGRRPGFVLSPFVHPWNPARGTRGGDGFCMK